jgi:hypothetical protein
LGRNSDGEGPFSHACFFALYVFQSSFATSTDDCSASSALITSRPFFITPNKTIETNEPTFQVVSLRCGSEFGRRRTILTC